MSVSVTVRPQVDFSALARAVVTLWDHHTLNAAVLIRAMRGLRSLLDLTAPANIPDQQTPQVSTNTKYKGPGSSGSTPLTWLLVVVLCCA